MATINQLSSVDTLQGGDQFPVYDQSNGDARKTSLTTLTAYIEANITPSGGGGGDAIKSVGVFTGDAIRTEFTLSTAITSTAGVQVFIDGVYQDSGSYTTTTSSVTFSAPPPLYSDIEVIVFNFSALVADTPAGNVTYQLNKTGAIARTVEGKLNDWVSIKDFGAKGDGLTDDTPAFVLAVASGAGAIHMPAGTYRITSTVTVNRDVSFFGEGNATKISVSGMPSSPAFLFTGAGPTLIESNANLIYAGERRYTFSSASHGLQKGDLFAVWDDNDFSYSYRRANYYKGEYLTVMSVDGAEVSFMESFYDTYSASSSKLYKVATCSVTLKDFNIIGADTFSGIEIDFGRQCVVDNVNMSFDTGRNGLYLHHCYDVSVANCSNTITEYIGASFNMYPFLVGNSQRIRIDNCDGKSRWHAISVGGAAEAPAIVNRNIIVTGCTLSSQNGAFAGDFHGNVEHSTYANCTFHGSGCTIGADYNSFVNNKIMDITRDVTGGAGPDVDHIGSQGFYSSEATGYNFLISGNLMECAGSYLANQFGRFIDIVRVADATQSHTSNLQIVNNNYLNLDTDQPFSDHIIRVFDASTVSVPSNVDILIDGNSFISKNDPVKPANSIIVKTDNTDASDKFRSVTITNNKLNKVDINIDYTGEVFISGNELVEPYQGIVLTDYLNCSIKNNIVRNSHAVGLRVSNGNGDYSIVEGNIIINSWSVVTPPTGVSTSADVGFDTTTDTDFVRFSNNYIKTNGNADFALIYNNAYNIQEFNNKIVGSGAIGKIENWFNDSSQYVVGGESLTTREFWHEGTTQTDFAVISFNNAGVNGSALVRLHMANNATGYTGILEFTLEGQDGATAVQSGTRYTSTSDPIAGGKVIVSIATDTVTLSLNGASATETIHCKAEIIKSCQTSVLRYLDVEWNV